ncbi:hypothetical protein ABZP36_011573 [Zizania latifolia]
MAEQQKMRIHPVDLEAGGQRRPTAPLVPGGSFRSDKGNPAAAAGSADKRPRPTQAHLPPPRRAAPPVPLLPPRRVAPPVPLPPPKRRRGCFCRFICCVVVTVVVLAVLAAAAVGALYLAFDPKAPRYSVDRLSVSAFQVDPMLTARARFDVTVTAANPNSRIGIYYEHGSSLSVCSVLDYLAIWVRDGFFWDRVICSICIAALLLPPMYILCS